MITTIHFLLRNVEKAALESGYLHKSVRDCIFEIVTSLQQFFAHPFSDTRFYYKYLLRFAHVPCMRSATGLRNTSLANVPLNFSQFWISVYDQCMVCKRSIAEGHLEKVTITLGDVVAASPIPLCSATHSSRGNLPAMPHPFLRHSFENILAARLESCSPSPNSRRPRRHLEHLLFQVKQKPRTGKPC